MRQLLSFETNGIIPNASGSIPRAFVERAEKTLLKDTRTYISNSALNCGLVLDRPFNIADAPQQRLIRAFSYGGTVALVAARLNLRMLHEKLGIKDSEFTSIEEILRINQLGPFPVDKDLGLQNEREAMVKSTGDEYGLASENIMSALRADYDVESNDKTDIAERRLVAALGFALVAPEVNNAVVTFHDFKAAVDDLHH